MRNIKKATALVLALLMALAVMLTGCKTPDAGEETPPRPAALSRQLKPTPPRLRAVTQQRSRLIRSRSSRLAAWRWRV